MPTVTITGTFNNASANNDLTIEIFRGIPQPYDVKMPPYKASFSLVLDTVVSGLKYDVDIDGSTPGTFDFSITGDVVATVSESYGNNIFDGLSFIVK